MSESPGPDVLSVYADYGPFKRWLRWLPEHDHPTDDADAVRALDGALDAAIRADDALGADGPWVGLLGFSQGAKMVASLLFRAQVLAESGGGGGGGVGAGAGLSSGGGAGSSSDGGGGALGGSGGSVVSSIRWRFAVILAGRSPIVSLVDPSVFSSPLLADPSEFGLHAPPDLMEVARGRHILKLPTIHVHGLSDPGLPLHRDLLDSYCDPATARLVEWDGAHRLPLKATDVNPVVEQMLEVARETGALEK